MAKGMNTFKHGSQGQQKTAGGGTKIAEVWDNI
jgi:hypothetical protein